MGGLLAAHVDAQHSTQAPTLVGQLHEQGVLGVRGQAGIGDLCPHSQQQFCHGQSSPGMLRHAQAQVGQTQRQLCRNVRVHRWSRQHQRAILEPHQGVDEGLGAAHHAGNDVRCAGDELGEGVHHHIGAKVGWGDDAGGERVVHHEQCAFAMSHSSQLGQRGDLEGGVGHGFCVHHLGIDAYGTLDCLHVGDVHKCGGDVRFGRQEMLQQRMRAPIDAVGCHNVIPAGAYSEKRTGDCTHA
mmetsp:Transcript_11661/g.20684  ORF Transcript_11661/g.20684 Transcript_11661/m.20684 type:complete len:241 (+) Transcript_11661:2031-2753(+)